MILIYRSISIFILSAFLSFLLIPKKDFLNFPSKKYFLKT